MTMIWMGKVRGDYVTTANWEVLTICNKFSSQRFSQQRAFSLSPFNRGFDVDVEQMEEEAPTISRLVRSV